MRLPLSPINSSRFLYHPDLRTFTAEVSELSEKFNFSQLLYDDACDMGFEMISAKTGENRVFLLTNHEQDVDGDTRYWEFECYKAEGKNRLVKVEPTIKCMIIND